MAKHFFLLFVCGFLLIGTAYANKKQTVSEIHSLINNMYLSIDKITYEILSQQKTVSNETEETFLKAKELLKKEAPILLYDSENKKQMCVHNSFSVLANHDNMLATQILIMMSKNENDASELNKWTLRGKEIDKKLSK